MQELQDLSTHEENKNQKWLIAAKEAKARP